MVGKLIGSTLAATAEQQAAALSRPFKELERWRDLPARRRQAHHAADFSQDGIAAQLTPTVETCPLSL